MMDFCSILCLYEIRVHISAKVVYEVGNGKVKTPLDVCFGLVFPSRLNKIVDGCFILSVF